ncbi:MAG: ATP-binding protein, partial [Candidatus Omnitrophica bacterium]|nr:ATP-binding protein [Candidatus Omnitrophota bacterium]
FEAYGAYPYFLSAVLKQLGFFVRGEEPDLVEQLVEQLRKLRSEDKRLLLIIDDAHEMSDAVWKRLQPWLDYQDRGVRMIQILLVGNSDFKKKIGEPTMRGWRRWVHGTYELTRIKKWNVASEEARRMLKRACDLINTKTQPTEPIRAPQISWFAVQKIVKESGGRPGRMNELLKRVLSASIREGGSRITYRFLMRADALRSPAMQWYKHRQKQGTTKTGGTSELKKKFRFSMGGKKMQERTKNPRVPEHPLGWMRYALGTLLIVFTLGAGWGITAWLSIDSSSTDSILLTESEMPGEEFEESSVESSTEDAPRFDVATTEPVAEYPLDVFDESWAEIDSVAVSQAISASLEQEFQELDSAGIQISDAFPPREEISMEPERSASVEPDSTAPAESAPAPQPEPVDNGSTLDTGTVVEAESPLDALEDFTLPERAPFLEEVVKVEAEPLNATALDVPEEL